MKRIHPLYLSILSGLLLYAAWPPIPLTFLIFIALVPFLMLTDQCEKRTVFFGWTYLMLLIWNAATTWWICKASVPGGISAILANSLLMSIPLLGYFNVKRRFGKWAGWLALICFWMTFEWVHLNWELSWPWLTLGNVFAAQPSWVQWYELTGTSGGTLWILLVNIGCYAILANRINGKKTTGKFVTALVVVLILPFVVSILLLQSAEKQQQARTGDNNVVAVQPNIDPWNEKFVAGQQEAQVHHLIQLSESQMDANTSLVVWPETAVPVAIDEDSMKHAYFMQPVWDFLQKNPRITLLTGIEGFRFYKEPQKTFYSSKVHGTDLWAEGYNSAVIMDSNEFIAYHKSKFVPGAENLPSFLHFMADWFEEFGGTTGTFAPQDQRTVLKTYNNTYAIAPAVCYESVYGEFMTNYIRKGANVIAIITNDGWWGNTAGYRQHESYARLRAIETRRWVIRSANTGISCFIDPTGKEIDAQPWDHSAAIKQNVPTSSEMTFFAKHGDILSRIIMALCLIIVIWDVVVIIKNRFGRG